MPATAIFYGQRRHAAAVMLISVLALVAFWLEMRWAGSELSEMERIPPILPLALFLPTFGLYLVSLVWFAFPQLSWIRLDADTISWRAFPGRKATHQLLSLTQVARDADDTVWLQGAGEQVALPYNAGLPGVVLAAVIEQHRRSAHSRAFLAE